MSTEGWRPEEVIAKLGLVMLADDGAREIVRIVAKVERTLEPRDTDKKWRYLMGVLMAELRGRVAGEKVAAYLKDALKTVD
jgi:Glu-tRNA(Gln) amidotransferase subunit E-like FAD-binding protein